MKFSVVSMGVATGHDPKEVIDRPEGTSFYLLTCFYTPFIGWQDGASFNGQPGDCILRQPGTPDYFASVPNATEGFRGDWLHLEGNSLSEWIKAYNVPTNRYVSTGNDHLLTELARAVARERETQQSYWESIAAGLVERMLILLARADQANQETSSLTLTERHHQERFVHLRQRFRTELGNDWNLEDMAKDVGLSVSRFCSLYRRLFNTTPNDDLLESRLSRAKEHLTSGTDSVGAIAEACGFSSIYHFSRMFKRKVGCSPREYASQNRL